MVWRPLTVAPPKGEPIWINYEGVEYPGRAINGIFMRAVHPDPREACANMKSWVRVFPGLDVLWRTILPERQDHLPEGVVRFNIDTVDERIEACPWMDDGQTEKYCRCASPEELRAILVPEAWWGDSSEFMRLCLATTSVVFQQRDWERRQAEIAEKAEAARLQAAAEAEKKAAEAETIEFAERIVEAKLTELANSLGAGFDFFDNDFIVVDFKAAKKIVEEHGEAHIAKWGEG